MVCRGTICSTTVFSGSCQEFFSGIWSISSSLSFPDLAAYRALSHFLTLLFHNLSSGFFFLLCLKGIITEARPGTGLLCSLWEQAVFCIDSLGFYSQRLLLELHNPSKPCHLNGMKILLSCNVTQTIIVFEYLKLKEERGKQHR